jgi:hypothetical protein
VKPSIVVFICHGSIEKGVGPLELTPDDRTQNDRLLSGNNFTICCNGIPQAVVMNGLRDGRIQPQASVPLAWEMVSEEITLAIGMDRAELAGTRACRLFRSRRFFAAQLRAKNRPHFDRGGAAGGMLHAHAIRAFGDWAMPLRCPSGWSER